MSAKDPPAESSVLDGASLGRVVHRMASAMVEELADDLVAQNVALIGIRRGGVGLARRLASELKELHPTVVPVGTVDIAFYRDDAATALPDPAWVQAM